MNLLVVVQARTGSTRLPGKVLLAVAGTPLLAAMLMRVRAARTAFELVVATTWNTEDDPIAELCTAIEVDCFRGHPTDLLDRHYRVALERNADAVVKIPSDCPLIDPAVIDRVLRYYTDYSRDFDYVSNLHPATYPDGNDVEVMQFDALETAFHKAHRSFEREHTTPFIWERPERFRIGNVTWDGEADYSMTHRFTIDYAEDYQFIARVFEELGGAGQVFGLPEILELLDRKPEIMAINAQHVGVNWYRHHLGELKQISAAQTKILEYR
jgi:spore coat polysaccharide biosynthesis protein SpsF